MMSRLKGGLGDAFQQARKDFVGDIRAIKGFGKSLRNGLSGVTNTVSDAVSNIRRGINGACSFTPETIVATPDGEIPISELQVGDEVLAYNEETGEVRTYEVTAIHVHEDEEILMHMDGELVITTPDHPFYSDGEWTAAGELEIGDTILQADGTTGIVQSLEIITNPQAMYNLTVDEAHTFFVGDGQWLVHNTCTPKLSDVRALRDAGLTREQRRLVYEKSAGVHNVDEFVPVSTEDNIMLSPFSSAAVKRPDWDQPRFPYSPAQSFDLLDQYANELNTRLLDDPQYADLQLVIPELEAADTIVFNMKTNLTQSNWLTTQELDYVLNNESILAKTQFLVGFFP